MSAVKVVLPIVESTLVQRIVSAKSGSLSPGKVNILVF